MNQPLHVSQYVISKIIGCKAIILLAILFIAFTNYTAQGQSMGISSTSITPDPSSILELRTTNKGLLAPRMNTTQRDAISSPATGLIIYNTSTNQFNFYNGTIWTVLATGSSALNSITGTTNRISIGGTSTDPTVDISNNYVGQTSITTLGTIGTGTWNGTSIAIANGGTGQTTAASAFNALSPVTTLGDIIYGSGTNTNARLAGNITSTKKFLTQTGNGSISAAPSWGTLSSSDVGLGNVENTALSTWTGSSNITTLGTIGTGTWNGTSIAIANGGTGQTTANAALNALLPSQTSNANKFLQTNGTNTSWVAGNSGTVTSASIVSANGFAGTVATATTTPAITLSTSVTGMLKGNGTSLSAATAGTDYSAGTSGLATGILKSTTTTGVLSIATASDFPILNQNTTGNAATVTTNANLTGDVTSIGNATTLATVNSNVGTWNNVTVNAKGLVTAGSNTSYVTSESDPIVKAITGIVKSNGTTISAATVRTDYAEPTTALATGLLKNTTTTGAHTIAVAGTDYQAPITLTTTGTSGAATFSSNTLNIPQYAGFANPMNTLGDVIYGGASGTATRLAGNTTSTKNFLTQTGNGTISAAPSWGTISSTDVGLGNVENTALSTWIGSTNLTTLGTIGTGTWNGSLISPTYGGTGVNNGTKTITLGGNLTTSGTFATTLTTTGTTNITLPTSGTLATTSNDLSVFASTTSSQLAGVLSDETGTGSAVFSASPTFTGTPTLPTGTIATTQAFGDASTKIATTSFVDAALPNYARVTTSNATTTGTTLTNITGLSVALAANTVYEFYASLSVASSSTAGTKYGVNFSAAGATVEATYVGTSSATATVAGRINALNTATGVLMAVAADGAVHISGVITTGANAGNLTVQHLKVTSGTSTVYINSFLKVVKIQ